MHFKTCMRKYLVSSIVVAIYHQTTKHGPKENWKHRWYLCHFKMLVEEGWTKTLGIGSCRYNGNVSDNKPTIFFKTNYKTCSKL